MKQKHKIAIAIIFLIATAVAFASGIEMTNAVALNMVVFLTVSFSIVLASAVALIGTPSLRKLHQHVDEKTMRRGTSIIKSYFLANAYWSVFTIAAIIVFKAMGVNTLLIAGLFGSGAVNVFILLLIVNFLAGRVEKL